MRCTLGLVWHGYCVSGSSCVRPRDDSCLCPLAVGLSCLTPRAYLFACSGWLGFAGIWCNMDRKTADVLGQRLSVVCHQRGVLPDDNKEEDLIRT